MAVSHVPRVGFEFDRMRKSVDARTGVLPREPLDHPDLNEQPGSPMGGDPVAAVTADAAK